MQDILKNIFYRVNKNIEIIIALFVVGIIGLIILPMDSNWLDIFLILNITLSITILLLTLFTTSVLEFSVFPTMLLIITLFRLGLNISSTRLILSDGNAGNVINAFASFVTNNNYIVGAIIFIIIVVIQFVVITNGASRVAEVGARFTLDAMPGKQMAIDADLNAGMIDEKTARKRRLDLQREADFYGSMDGASKFVKGDAIAGIIITLINFIGGIAIFAGQGDYSISEALQKFGQLTIGDGLVSQIPALLVSISSGILITRSGDNKSFGIQLSEQLFSTPKVLMITSIVLIIIGIIPAFPTVPFVLVAIIIAGISYLLLEDEKTQKAQTEISMTQQAEEQKTIEEDQFKSVQVEPLEIEIGYSLIPLVDDSSGGDLLAHIAAIRKQCAFELGIVISPIRIRDNLQLNSNEYIIRIKGNEIAKGEIYKDKYLVMDPGTSDFELKGTKTKEPAFGLEALWIDNSEKEKAELLEYTVVDPITVLITHLKEIIKNHSYELIGRQEVKELIEGLKDKYNVVIDELIPDLMTLGEVQKVLQNLLKEQVPITDLVTILECLADSALNIKDTETLTERVRHALKRTIVKKHLDNNKILNVVTIHPNIEELINNSIQRSFQGSFPAIDPKITTAIFNSVKHILESLVIKGIQPVILASPRIRIAFRNMIHITFPQLAVLSLNEIPNEVEIEAVGMVEINDS